MPDHRGHQGHRGQHNQEEQIPRQIIESIKTCDDLSKLSASELVSIAEKVGKHLKDIGLKTTQIRRFLDGVRKIDNQFKTDKNKFNGELVILLKPKLAYAAGREEKVKPLMKVLDPAIDKGAKSYESFKKLIALIEGIVAYHKYYGGGD
ncbi:MAG: type III-A CRISPR-associated protein Csm2 [Thermodesulfovibrio sp.]|jgi:CRISPR-associated protein Csm2|uniref:type III-A CRISPR-associated protein Csm2 n=1 Tax=unclassified Thermodesulfovibrio TaxID=2645936 RepID=UPI00083A774F|nr:MULTISPECIES: type III-A CRISPR-associated protein Csm2 [unclassified Thermodesulfovibrio]MDI1471301.1 type III-A CRISPR-associated protein Csm2 [Thermodesulfovibrio sp. 1176]MDI6714695.1 type III-A CRISPR-associated protein Csm2 [Thermodesulfovibrio sp.]ODA43439.1 CRISPR-associated protein, Csm2 family [Thermodesulfovibrio sp. N1]